MCLVPANVETAIEVIARLNREERLTILLVEQNASMAPSVATVAYVLRRGEIALHGATAELLQDTTVRRL